jgi:LysM repeat protein
MADARCHYCRRPAQSECPTCGRLYCAEHGEEVCLRCLSPEAATPSALVYRGALFALAVGTLVTIFLLVSPPESASLKDTARPVATPTPAVTTTATPTPRPTGTATATVTATATTPTAASPTPTGTPGGRTIHVVASGDSLSRIADLYDVTIEQLIAANPGLTENIQIGQEIIIPTP